MIRIKNNWLHSPLFDSVFILAPAFLSIMFVFYLGDEAESALPLWMWVVMVMGIDVSHVYSTLFKTYFQNDEFEARKSLYTFAPIIVWITGIFIYSIGAGLFWSILAYLAVFHFIRQQYGFIRLYGKDENFRLMDSITIYASTLYPVIFWHTYPRDFHWFIDGDFKTGLPEIVEFIAFWIYLFILAAYAVKEMVVIFKNREVNIPRNTIVLSTALSWYLGIVWFNGDIAFTVTNVVAHGIPYMALIWIWGRKNEAKHFTKSYSVLIFLGALFFLAYVEEGFWAGLVWREHLEVFNIFRHFPVVTDKATLSWIVPLLTLPQATHYVLDGFIWKGKAPHGQR